MTLTSQCMISSKHFTIYFTIFYHRQYDIDLTVYDIVQTFNHIFYHIVPYTISLTYAIYRLDIFIVNEAHADASKQSLQNITDGCNQQFQNYPIRKIIVFISIIYNHRWFKSSLYTPPDITSINIAFLWLLLLWSLYYCCAITHWPLEDVAIILNVQFSNSHCSQ